jgi:outer membrane protein, heavy metal efflux system
MKQPILFLLLFFGFATPCFANTLTPNEILKELYSANPELAASKARADAEKSAISSNYSLNNPRIGVMHESNLTAEQRQMGDMQSWMISQEIMFPTKYFLMGSMQRSKAEVAMEEYLDKKLEIRQEALSQYYKYYSSSKISSLLEAQRETLREIARIVETRRATGAVPQQDEMKAHLEQTKIENEILLQNQEVVEVRSSLNALLDREPNFAIALPKDELKAPKITESMEQIRSSALKNSKEISAKQAMLSEAESTRTFTKMSYLPDFMFSYQKPFGDNAPENAYAFNVEMTIPLWFFSKQNSEVSTAAAKTIEAEKKLEQAKRQVEAETENLGSKAETLSKLLSIYETALIPQSTSALNSSRVAYGAGRVGFQELLDAERSLYSVRVEYYRNLTKFVETLTSLERTVGRAVSNLPIDGDKL